MAYSTKQKVNTSGLEDAHSRLITARHVRGVGVAAPRGGNMATDANTDDLAMTLVADCDTAINTTPGVNQYLAGGGAAGPVFLARAVVVATGAAAVQFFDNAGPAGTVTGIALGAVPSTATLGQQFQFQLPVKQGLSIINPAGAVQLAVGYA